MTGPRGPYTRINPWLTEDVDGSVVINMADVLLSAGLPDTPENRELGWIVLKGLGILSQDDDTAPWRPDLVPSR